MDHHGGIRFCPRCGQETIWTNLPDRGERLRCTTREIVEASAQGWGKWGDPAPNVRQVDGCGYDDTQAHTLTDQQRWAFRAYAAVFDRDPVEQTYEFV